METALEAYVYVCINSIDTKKWERENKHNILIKIDKIRIWLITANGFWALLNECVLHFQLANTKWYVFGKHQQ